MKEFIEDFLSYLSVERGLANNTLIAYRRDIQKYCEHLGKKDIASTNQVSRKDITEYIYHQKKTGLSTTSICC